MPRKVHLVGSIRLENAESVFRALAEKVGTRASRYPDGETGERHYWIVWQGQVFETSPSFKQAPEPLRPGAPMMPFELLEDVRPDQIEIGALGYSKAAIESYQVFAKLRTEGVIPAGTRFMVALPTPVAVVTAFVVAGPREHVEVAYERALLKELDEIIASIPSDDLAIQWDVMAEVIAHDGWDSKMHYSDILKGTLERLQKLSRSIPDDVELGFHLCYGDPGHKHLVEPMDLGTSVKFANGIVRSVDRRVDWIHMAVPRDRSDDAYFAPLDGLELPACTQLALGLLHYTDGVEGTRRRLQTAVGHRQDFAIATECGFGRRDPATMLELLDLHATTADGA